VTYVNLTNDQADYLRGIVAGKVVADLGCGDGSLAVTMANMGAAAVHAVDKAPVCIRHRGVVVHQSYFDRWTMPEGVHVAVVSWPHNSGLPGIPKLLRGVPDVIYIGKNTDGTSCGSGAMFALLIRRTTLRYIPDPRNVMIHYGNEPRPDRALHHEEIAAITQASLYRYDPTPERLDAVSWRRP